MTRRGALAVAVLAALLSVTGNAGVRAEQQRDWSVEKCALYKRAYSRAITRQGLQGIGAEFLRQHEAFLASGCTADVYVCARSPQEIELVNLLVVLGMNEGMASTFFPFRCRK